MIAITVVEDLGIIAEFLIGVAVLLAVIFAGWRGIRIVVVHRRNGENE